MCFNEAFAGAHSTFFATLGPVDDLSIQHRHDALTAMRVQWRPRPWREIQHQIDDIKYRGGRVTSIVVR